MSVATAVRPSVIRTAPLFFVNSVLAATIGVAAARLVELMSLGIAAAIAGMDPVLTNGGVVFGASGPAAIETAGTIGMLIVGLSLLLMYPGSRDRSVGRLTMLWTMLFCFRGGLVAVVSAGLDETTVMGSLLADLGPPAWLGPTVAVLALLAIGGIGVGAAPAFLSFARHWSEVSSKPERIRFITLVAVVPAVLGPLGAIPMFMPDGASGFVSGLPLAGTFVVVTFVAALFTTSFRPPQVIEERGLSFGLIAAVALVAVLMRLGVGPGVPLPPWDESLSLTFRR
jgi:hypothetical protein